MASLQYSFKSRYPLKNYKDVVDTYEWLAHCLIYSFSDYNELTIVSTFSFSCGSLIIECKSIDEFKEHAFGLDITPRDFFVCGSESSGYLSKTLAHFWTRNNPEDVAPMLELTCYDRKHLIEVKDSLDLDMSVLVSKQSNKVESESDDYKATIDNTNKLQDSTTQLPVSKEANYNEHKVFFFSKLFWKLIIPIAVIVISTALIWLLQVK